ncbi:unnamed protein product [Lactuca saligna]|uniref:Uncharacterized protein n=1 Tax=Lactuca saligna TaxID=75948 RepID=A0AA35UZU1_LACSI|nr:unnamed protein product [Lactuca saligna]
MDKQVPLDPSSPVVAHEVVTPIQIDVGEGDLGLALTLYKSATPEFSRSKVDAEKELNKEIDVNEELDMNKSNGEGVEGFADEDEDSDFMIDEDNIIEDVDVDMEDFNLNIDTEAEFNGCQSLGGQRNEDSDEEDDLEVIDNDEWDSLSDDQ